MREAKKMLDESRPFVVVTGQIADGFSFVGPFATYEHACEYAGELGEAWWIEVIHAPEDE